MAEVTESAIDSLSYTAGYNMCLEHSLVRLQSQLWELRTMGKKTLSKIEGRACEMAQGIVITLIDDLKTEMEQRR